MSTLVEQELFREFGPSLIPDIARLPCAKLAFDCERTESRRRVRTEVPTSPGVYGMIDSAGRLIYVGKSKALRYRLLSYLSKTPHDEKMQRIIHHAREVIFEPLSHELLALIREQELICRWRPQYNSQGQPDRRQPAFVCVSGGSAPHVYHARQLSARTLNAFGPVAGSGQMRAAALSLNYAFGLRDCADKTPMHFPEQRLLFAEDRNALCLRHELGTCVAPCAGVCSRDAYQQRVKLATDFLHGNDRSVLIRLNQEMSKAAQRKAFEKAAVLRDQLDALAWLDRRLTSLRDARLLIHGALPLPAFGERHVWLMLSRSLLETIVSRPSSGELAHSCLQIAQQCQAPGEGLPPSNQAAILMQLVVISWFRKHRDEPSRLIPFEKVSSLCRTLVRRSRTKLVA
jgi:excinuclease ABC subunit C